MKRLNLCENQSFTYGKVFEHSVLLLGMIWIVFSRLYRNSIAPCLVHYELTDESVFSYLCMSGVWCNCQV